MGRFQNPLMSLASQKQVQNDRQNTAYLREKCIMPLHCVWICMFYCIYSWQLQYKDHTKILNYQNQHTGNGECTNN